MKLIHNQIPVEFLSELPEGVKLVKRKGREFLVIEEVVSRGGHSLMSDDVRIHGEPSILMHVTIDDTAGPIFLDAYWGSHAKLYGFLPTVAGADPVIDASVPESQESLMVDSFCEVDGCGCKRAVELLLPGGENKILVCARMGCPGHRMVLSRMPKMVSDTISGINFFGAGSLDEDWFSELV